MEVLKRLFGKVVPWYDPDEIEERHKDTERKRAESKIAIEESKIELFKSYKRSGRVMAHRGI